jgi:two-component system, cell cycle sensor histidine kinase and response regulator CckA
MADQHDGGANDGKGAPEDSEPEQKQSPAAEPRASSLFSFFKDRAQRARHAVRGPQSALVVDDEELVRRFVDRVLREANYRTSLAADGVEAIKLAAEHGPFDILVTDLMMPEMMGDELARRLRQNDPGLKVLYLTGFSDHLFKEKVTLWQDEAYLDKPCSVKALLQAVSLLLTGHFEIVDPT